MIFFQYNHEYRIRGGKFNKNVWLFSWFFVVFYFHDYLIFIPKEYNIFMILVFHEKYWVYSIFYANNRGSSNDSVFFFLKQVTTTLYPNLFSFYLYNIEMNKKSSNIWELPYIDIQKSELRSYCQVSLWDESGYWKFIEPYIQKRFPLRQLRFKLEYKCFFVFFYFRNRSSEYEYDLSSLHVQKDGESLTYIPVVRIIILGCETKQDYSVCS